MIVSKQVRSKMRREGENWENRAVDGRISEAYTHTHSHTLELPVPGTSAASVNHLDEDGWTEGKQQFGSSSRAPASLCSQS